MVSYQNIDLNPMSKRDNPVALVFALVVTFGLSVAAIWLTGNIGFGLLSNSENKSGTKTNTPVNNQQLTVLGDTFSGYSTFRSSAFQQALKEAGLTVAYQDEFDQGKRAERLNKGEADLIVTTLDQFLKQKPDGKIIGLIDTTVGADAVILNTKKYPKLKSLVDLNRIVQESRTKGEKLIISFASDTPSEYLANILSTKFESFKLSDFQVNRVTDASEAWKLLQDPSKNIAVAVLWEPYVSQARQKGYKVLISSQDTPRAIVDVIVASNKLITSNPEKVSEFLAKYYNNIDTAIQDISSLEKQIAEDGKLSPTDAKNVLQGIDFFTSVKTLNWLTNGTLDKQITSTASVLNQTGKISTLPSAPNSLHNSTFIGKAAQNTQTLINSLRITKPELVDKLEGKIKFVKNDIQPDKSSDIGNFQVTGSIKFATDSSSLTDEGKQVLNQLATQLSEFNENTVAVKVIGHTSKFGATDFNKTVSQQRAQTVVNYLNSQGVKLKMIAEGKGETQPLKGLDPEDKRNQRTEIRLIRVN
jgi:OmpA-OmpF porin, OOP family